MATTYALNLVGIVPSLFTVYFSTRIFAPEVSGQLALVSTAAVFIQSIGFVWLSNALIRFGKEEYIQSGGIRQTFRARAILLSAIWIVTLCTFFSLYVFAHNLLTVRIGLSGRILWALPVFLTLWVVAAELNGYLRVLGKYVQLAASGLVSQLFQAVALFLLYKYLGVAGIDWLIALSVGGSISQSLFLVLWLKSGNLRLGATSALKDELRRTVRYSAPAIGTATLGYLYKPIEYYLILYFVSVGAVGLFNTANSMNMILAQFVLLFPSLMFPILQGLKATGKQDVIRRYYCGIVPQLTILFAICVSVALVCLPPAMRLLLGQQYYPSIGAFLVLAYAEILHMTTALDSIYPAMYDRLVQTFWVTGLQYVCELVCYFVLIPRVGIEGAAWAWVAAYLASALLLKHYVSHEFGVSFRAYLGVALSALLGFVALMLARSGFHISIQLLILLATMAPTVIAIKAGKFFEYSDVELLMMTGIPRFLQSTLRSIYRMLG